MAALCFVSMLILWLLSVSGSHAQFSPNNSLSLKTPLGTILGRYETGLFGTARAFYGVPFAKPPVGSKRFTYSEYDSAPWKNNFINGSTPSPICVESISATTAPYGGDEDCLYLDIVVPMNSSTTDKLPVYLDIPGGGYVSTYFENGTNYVSASQSLIYVFAHYRSNIFGLLSTAGLSQETAPYQSSGNYALSDWTLALQWVHDNIAIFGGDPDRVTLHGGSAGAWAMSNMQVMPQTKGLFQQIAVDSGGSDQSITVGTLEEKELYGQVLATAAGCPWDRTIDANYSMQNDCLRKASVTDLMNAYVSQNSYAWFDEHALFPAPDGWWLPDYPQTLFANGSFHHVPILAGASLDEMNYISIASFPGTTGAWHYNTTTYDDVAGWCKNLTSKRGIEVKAIGALTDYYLDRNNTFDVLVPRNDTDIVGTGNGPTAAMIEISSGMIFQCPIRRNLRYQAAAGQPAYGYAFGYRSRNAFIGGLTGFAFHGSASIDLIPTAAQVADPIDASIIHAQQQYLMSFVINGNPNDFSNLTLSYGVNQSLPLWPIHTETNDMVLRIGDHNILQNATIVADTGVFSYCDLQDAVIPYYSYAPRCAAGHMLSADFKTCI